MASHKRKGRDVFDDDILASPAPAVVILGSSPSLTMAGRSPAIANASPFSPSLFAGGGGGTIFSPVSSFGKNRDPIERIRNRLKEFQGNYSPPTTTTTDENDPVLQAIENIKKDHNSQDENLKQLELQSKTIQDQLKEQIRQAKDACKQESNVLTEMASKLQALHDKRKSLIQDMEQLDALQEDLQSRIELHKEEATRLKRLIRPRRNGNDSFHDSRHRFLSMPRRRASNGITVMIQIRITFCRVKWYVPTPSVKQEGEPFSWSCGTALLKSLVVPFFSIISSLRLVYLVTQAVDSKQTLKQFAIDKEEHSPYEVADQLWSLMAGKTS
jgi:small-conductance mechanosensitive channel